MGLNLAVSIALMEVSDLETGTSDLETSPSGLRRMY